HSSTSPSGRSARASVKSASLNFSGRADGLAFDVSAHDRVGEREVVQGITAGSPRLALLDDAGVELAQLALEGLVVRDRPLRAPRGGGSGLAALEDEPGGHAAQERRRELEDAARVRRG